MAEVSENISEPAPAEIVQDAAEQARAGDVLFAQGQYQQALLCYHSAVTQEPKDASYHYRSGLACARLGQQDAAVFSLTRAMMLQPNFAPAYAEFSRIRLAAGKTNEALRHAREACRLAPEDIEIAMGLAALLEVTRDTDAAMAIIDRFLKAGRVTPSLVILFGRISKRGGRDTEALGLIDRLLAMDGESRILSTADRASLHYTAAYLLDRKGRYDEAFDHAAKATAARGGKYLPGEVERQVDLWSNYFTPATLQRLPRARHGSQLPVFIVGMPRSGTTLVEQILASHPAVHGAGELPWVERLWSSLWQKNGAGAIDLTECLDRLTAAGADDLAAEYLKPLKALAPMALRITDKMPINFIHLGLIAILFPECRIIHCRREALDTCLSCYMTDFADFCYGSLEAFGHFHRQSERIMAHWKAVLSTPILEVDYAQMVDNTEAQARRLVEFIGLPWDARVLQFHENKRFVATASRAQVRQPVYRSSIERWRNYDKHLGPLRAALAGAPVTGRTNQS